MDARGATRRVAIIDYAWVTYHFAAQHFGALTLYRARAERGGCVQTRRLIVSSRYVGGVLVFVEDILRRSGRLSGPVDRLMVVPRVDRVSPERNSRRRDRGAANCDWHNAVRRAARCEVVVAAHIIILSIYCRHCGDGRPCSAPAELVSLPGDLDFAALDSRHGTGFANPGR